MLTYCSRFAQWRMKKIHLILALSTTLGVASAFSAETTSTSAAPTDPQIAMIAVTADNVDIDAGKLAASKAADPKVKEFAELMVRDHTSVNDQATALAKRLNVTPEESATSKSLKADGDKMLTKLKGLSGAAFDKAYVDNEVTYHQTVLDAIDKTLIPNAKNADLKSLLESVRPVIASHLDHAKMIQKSVK
jgi:putative membrane protein